MLQPYSLGGGGGEGTIYPGSRPLGITTRSPRMVTECLLTRATLIKMYLPFRGVCLYMYIVCTVSHLSGKLDHVLPHEANRIKTSSTAHVVVLHRSTASMENQRSSANLFFILVH